jgi:hypothetical protein
MSKELLISAYNIAELPRFRNCLEDDSLCAVYQFIIDDLNAVKWEGGR